MLRASQLLQPTLVAWVFACAAACVAFAGVPAIAPAQSLPSVALPTPEELPPGVQREGVYLTAPVVVDGVTLFRIATPLLAAGDAMPVDVRAAYVNESIGEILALEAGNTAKTVYSPDSFRVSIQHDGNQVVLVANGDNQAPLSILTVTSADAKYHGTTVDALAASWQGILESQLKAALIKRQPAEVRRSVRDTILLGIYLLAGTLIALLLVRFLRGTRQRWATVTATIVSWAIVPAWFGIVVYALLLFPTTASLGQSILQGTVRVALVLVTAYLINSLIDALIPRVVSPSVLGAQYGSAADVARAQLRVPTVRRALSDFKLGIILFVALLAAMSQTGIPVASVVTIGGLIAIAASFAAQNIVRDVLNGFLVLIEDQYVVGDFVTIGAFSGIVEHLNVRMVQVRDAAGSLITIPHSSAVQTVNQSRNWSRVDYTIPIDPGGDVSEAIHLVNEVIDEIRKEEPWHDAILGPAEWVGLQSVARGSAVVRAWVRTAPLRQFELQRELNARVLAAFEKNGIALGLDAGTAKAVVA